LAEHRRQYEIQTPVQDGFITPRGVGDHMMQRLMHTSHIVWSQSRGHRLDALALAWQQQPGAVVLQRHVSISVPCGFHQALAYAAKRCSCGPGAFSLPTKQFYTQIVRYNTVVLAGIEVAII
jgi:hypothetical protein